MMVIDFEVDHGVLEEDLRASPVTADAGALEETFFVMPVKFVVNGADLLTLSGQQAHALPLLGFSTHMVRALDEMHSTDERRVYLAGGGDISLRAIGDRVEVHSSLTHRRVTVDRTELLVAFRDFADRVKRQLLALVPGMVSHPHWLIWFPRKDK